jgi:hypothetical protein
MGHIHDPHPALSMRQNGLLAGYLLNRKRGPAKIRKMIREDMDRFAEMGANQYALDLAEVLKRFDAASQESFGRA